MLCAAALPGAVTRVYLESRTDVLSGRPIGSTPGYERIQAKVHFAVDPANPFNQQIRDLALAPKNEKGLVEFTADVDVLRPRDPAKGNGVVLVEVPNRGGKGMLNRFQYGRGGVNPQAEADFGDFWLLEQGYTLVWLGWQWDVPQTEGLLRATFPAVAGVKGPVRAQMIPTAKTTFMPFADRNHLPYPVADPKSIKLMVRKGAMAAPAPVTIAFTLRADGTGLDMPAGFQPGLVYEAVYTSENPPVVGLGLAAFRDFVSWLRYQGDALSPLGDMRGKVKHTLAFGISQSGRFLRTFLFYGFNADERGRRVFDGVWADVAGAGRGSFNHRFAQASRDGHPYLNIHYPTDLPPFSGLLTSTPETAQPKIFYTNGSYEYWGRNAALIHTNLDGTEDLELPGNVRHYAMSGAAHGPGGMPRRIDTARYLTNPDDYRPVQRALLAALTAWVRDDTAPPPSLHATLAAKTLTGFGAVAFPKTPGITVPRRPKSALPLLFGPDFTEKGIVTVEPPRLGTPWPVLVPQTGPDGNELAGVKMSYVAVPLGSFAGWNMRTPETGAPEEIAEMIGSFHPFPRTKEDKAKTKDPRPSLEELYQSKDDYLAKVDGASDELIAARFLLPQDKARVRQRASDLWDFVMKDPAMK